MVREGDIGTVLDQHPGKGGKQALLASLLTATPEADSQAQPELQKRNAAGIAPFGETLFRDQSAADQTQKHGQEIERQFRQSTGRTQGLDKIADVDILRQAFLEPRKTGDFFAGKLP